MWCYVDHTIKNTKSTIIDLSSGPSTNIILEWKNTDATNAEIKFIYYDNNGDEMTTGDVTVDNISSKWNHLAVTVSRKNSSSKSTVKLYVNGVEEYNNILDNYIPNIDRDKLYIGTSLGQEDSPTDTQNLMEKCLIYLYLIQNY